MVTVAEMNGVFERRNPRERQSFEISNPHFSRRFRAHKGDSVEFESTILLQSRRSTTFVRKRPM